MKSNNIHPAEILHCSVTELHEWFKSYIQYDNTRLSKIKILTACARLYGHDIGSHYFPIKSHLFKDKEYGLYGLTRNEPNYFRKFCGVAYYWYINSRANPPVLAPNEYRQIVSKLIKCPHYIDQLLIHSDINKLEICFKKHRGNTNAKI